eukprot:6461958-Prorocentrum_lima.AAC.1
MQLFGSGDGVGGVCTCLSERHPTSLPPAPPATHYTQSLSPERPRRIKGQDPCWVRHDSRSNSVGYRHTSPG